MSNEKKNETVGFYLTFLTQEISREMHNVKNDNKYIQ